MATGKHSEAKHHCCFSVMLLQGFVTLAEGGTPVSLLLWCLLAQSQQYSLELYYSIQLHINHISVIIPHFSPL